jgi:hypothetical protein
MTARSVRGRGSKRMLGLTVLASACLAPAWSWLHQHPQSLLHRHRSGAAATSSASFRPPANEPPHQQHSSLLLPPLRLASSDDPGDDIIPWTLPNDFDTFLNQCCIQSFLFLLQSLRDGNSAVWLDNFTQPVVSDHDLPLSVAGSTTRAADSVKLLHYHGLAALNATLFPTWDAYFGTLLDQPKVWYTITSNRAYIPDYQLEIVPASLCSRLVSVREQIAREFAKDLDVISASMGRKALEAYMMSSTSSALKGGAAGTTDDHGAASESALSDSDLEQAPSSAQQRRLQRPSLFFLEIAADGNAVDPSPLRKGNFDLLLLLCTQEAVHRVLQDSDMDSASRYYLQNFYLERLYTHFMGSVPYGRGDDFLEELLWQTPRLVHSRSAHEDSLVSWLFSYQLVDPLRLAEAILHQREIVASEWRDQAAEAPLHHMGIKRMQLNLLMGRPANMTMDALG